MGKRLTQQARGKGSLTFRVRRAAYKYKIGYPRLDSEGKFTIIKLLNSAGHSAPLMKAVIGTETFISPAIRGVYEGQELEIGGKNLKEGNIIKLKDIPTGTRISNIEKVPGKGGVFMRVSGSSAVVTDNDGKVVEININNRRRIKINGEARASIGTIAGDGER
jgi:large subunit ribosomal protein L2